MSTEGKKSNSVKDAPLVKLSNVPAPSDNFWHRYSLEELIELISILVDLHRLWLDYEVKSSRDEKMQRKAIKRIYEIEILSDKLDCVINHRIRLKFNFTEEEWPFGLEYV